jgi:hypothetical protein
MNAKRPLDARRMQCGSAPADSMVAEGLVAKRLKKVRFIFKAKRY